MATETITDLQAIFNRVEGLSTRRFLEAVVAAQTHAFRVTPFYLNNVLNGRADDPLLDVVLPSAQESDPVTETWDANQALDVRAVDSPLWSQKYPQEGLIRLNTFCSALCRYCYVRERTDARLPANTGILESIFSQLSLPRARDVREVILSGGDPLTSAPSLLALIGERMKVCNEARREQRLTNLQLTVHTREPVWRPDYFLAHSETFQRALGTLEAYAYVFQVIHPREATAEFQKVVAMIASAGSRKPLLLLQHPLFRGINDSAEILAELYQKLAESTPIKPYYVVHPFDSGTLPKHRLSLPESQGIMQNLLRRVPGIQMPTLVVPTPLGKAYVSPYEPLVPGSVPGRWQLRTKSGELVDYIDLALSPARGSASGPEPPR